jgi:hypothetical protein
VETGAGSQVCHQASPATLRLKPGDLRRPVVPGARRRPARWRGRAAEGFVAMIRTSSFAEIDLTEAERQTVIRDPDCCAAIPIRGCVGRRIRHDRPGYCSLRGRGLRVHRHVEFDDVEADGHLAHPHHTAIGVSCRRQPPRSPTTRDGRLGPRITPMTPTPRGPGRARQPATSVVASVRVLAKKS